MAECLLRTRELLSVDSGLRISQEGGENGENFDAQWRLQGGDGRSTDIAVKAFPRFTPRALASIIWSTESKQLANVRPLLIVAPWFSPSSRKNIEAHGWNYIDLTGNTLIRIAEPAVIVRTTGADSDPLPRRRSSVLLRGAQVNALVRLLADVEPPYRIRDLARAAQLSEGYVSRTIQSLVDLGMVERDRRGPITDVDWLELLRLRAQEYDIFRNNINQGYVSRQGPRTLLETASNDRGVVVTGSFAAEWINPVASPTQLVLYVPDIRSYARDHDLLPASRGVNVVLLQASSPAQLSRPRLVSGAQHAGYSQLVQDLLSGPGRMPEEGEAVIEWMLSNPFWRLPELPK